ncbi:hypothetical protein ACQWCV_24500, partial [Salmonella enterica subsp. enterica serovar Infantis]
KVHAKTESTIRHADLPGVFCSLAGSMNQK